MILTVKSNGRRGVADYWITGPAGFTDAGDPNSVAPAASRIMSMPRRVLFFSESSSLAGATGLRALAFLADGTTATMRFWWFDDAIGVWIGLGSAAAAATYATTNRLAVAIRNVPGLKTFLQISANTGVSKVAVAFS